MNNSLHARLRKLEEVRINLNDSHGNVAIIDPGEMLPEERAAAMEVGRRYAALTGKEGGVIDERLLSTEDLKVLAAIGSNIEARRAAARS